MRYLKTIFLVVATISAIAVAGDGNGGGSGQGASRHFLGLWEGVDVNDGSLRHISITDHDRDGVFEVASRDTYWTLCDGDRGIELAVGGVGRDGVLSTDGWVTCFETGIELPVQQTYRYSRHDDTLLATPSVPNLVPITLHRASQ